MHWQIKIFTTELIRPVHCLHHVKLYIPVYSFNHAHTTLLLGCTDFTQGFRHSNLDSNPSPG